LKKKCSVGSPGRSVVVGAGWVVVGAWVVAGAWVVDDADVVGVAADSVVGATIVEEAGVWASAAVVVVELSLQAAIININATTTDTACIPCFMSPPVVRLIALSR
jgi:hypothetical protein